jgi:MYXO-CTERM domain-containing protein
MTVQCVGSSNCGDNTIAATGEWEGGSTAQKGTCEGDSGGPALDSLNRILGTVSRGPSGACNQTVYESTYDSGSTSTTNGAWIKQIAQQAATAGGYTPAGWVTGGATSDPANGYCGGSSTDGGAGDTDAGKDGGTTPADGGVDSGSGVVDSGTSEEGSTGDGGAVGDAGGAPPSEGGAGSTDAGDDDASTGANEDSGSVPPPGQDASLADAGNTSTPDATASGNDGAATVSDDAGDGLSGASGGCGCATVGSTDAAPSWLAWMGAGAVAAFVGARRRRRADGPRRA